jgi:uncharacterized membrane protein YdjX (TVP38/TMEM64 family)
MTSSPGTPAADAEPGESGVTPNAGWSAAIRIGAAIAALVGLVLVGRYLGGYLQDFAQWVDGLGFWAPAVFVAAYIVAVVAFVPASLLTLAAGAIFGLWEGVVYVFVAATVGAACAFLVARYVARSAIEKRLAGNERLAAIDRAVGEEGRKIIFLLRLTPVIPFNALNYGLGLTRVRFADYVIASFGMIPGTFLYVYSGKLAGDVAVLASGAEVARGTGYYALVGLGLLATIAVTVLVTRIARRALAEASLAAPVAPVDPVD